MGIHLGDRGALDCIVLRRGVSVVGGVVSRGLLMGLVYVVSLDWGWKGI